MIIELYEKMFQVLVPSNLKKFCKRKDGTVKKGIFIYFLAWVISSILILIAMHLDFTLSEWTFEAMETQYSEAWWTIASAPFYVILSYLGIYILNWFLIRTFKTKNRLQQLFYVSMLLGGGIAIISSLITFLRIFDMNVYLVVLGLVTIYELVLSLLSIKWIYKLSMGKTIVSGISVGLLFGLIALGAAIAFTILMIGIAQFGFCILAVIFLIILILGFIHKIFFKKKKS